MIIYKFTVDAVRERFMEPVLRDKHERYVAADTYEHAHNYICGTLERAGWKVIKISGKEVLLEDVRNPRNRTTS